MQDQESVFKVKKGMRASYVSDNESVFTVKKGMRVSYVSDNELKKKNPIKIENGVISSFDFEGAWIKFDLPGKKMITGDEDLIAQKCYYRNIFVSNKSE